MTPQHVDDVDWDSWEPEQRATLVFIIRNEEVLLIHKKRGLGKGKINGPGGRIEPGETPLQCAVREIEEEICVTPSKLSMTGELHFQFTDGLSIHCHVYRAGAFSGVPGETDEALPFWTSFDAIPYDRMWADDIIWLPLLLANRPFKGWFIFDDDTMLSHRVLELGS